MKNFTPLFLIAFAIIIGYLYVLPQYGKINTLRAHQMELSTTLDQAKKISELRNTLSAQVQAIAPADLDKLKRVFPAVYDPVKLASDIEIVAKRNGVVVRDVKTQIPTDSSRDTVIAPTTVTPYKVVQLIFTAKGSYLGFYNFLKSLESSVQILDVKKVSIAGSKSSTNTTSLDFEITLDTYWNQ
jgi:Tfp pilus assembly protein PilO